MARGVSGWGWVVWTAAWAGRLILVASVSAGMAVLGYQIMFKFGEERWIVDRGALLFVVPSVVFWLALAVPLRRGTYVTAVGWGLLSPLIASLPVGGLAGPLVALVLGYVAFPMGMLTGLLVKLCVSSGRQPAGAAQLPTPAIAATAPDC